MLTGGICVKPALALRRPSDVHANLMLPAANARTGALKNGAMLSIEVQDTHMPVVVLTPMVGDVGDCIGHIEWKRAIAVTDHWLYVATALHPAGSPIPDLPVVSLLLQEQVPGGVSDAQ